MKPHAELFRHLIINNLWTLQYATPLDVAIPVIAHIEGNTPVLPVDKIFRRVAHHTYHGRRGGVTLILAKPVIGITIFHDSSSVSIDMPPAGIGPNLSWTYYPWLFLPCVPVVFYAPGLGFGDMDYRTMFGR